jgi:riboflavin kinase/FMN adenylyltransferase
MRILRDRSSIPPEARNASAAIGNFDGVHLGHQAVIDLARRDGAPLGVLTFEPHPREWFAPDAPPFRLMNAQAKAHRLEMLGVDTLFELPFDAPLASLSPEDFVHRRPRPRPRPLPRGRRRRLPLRQGPRGLGRDVPRPRPRGGMEVTIAPMVELEGSEVSSTASARP